LLQLFLTLRRLRNLAFDIRTMGPPLINIDNVAEAIAYAEGEG
jgi:hypothetical protein